ncbi:hypothetical protein AB0I60_29765 [Actinosynnema sp. NPDC050436]|uniref:hypothetical protein n=1 Tax=Actinosynnema sp. NPDC050436 TaxID=3155659 RepID=UPI0033CD7CA3
MKRLAVGLVCLVVTGCAAPAADHGRASAPTTGGTTAATTPAPTTTTHAEVPVPAKLSPHGKDVLAKARQNGVASVVLVISTEAGATERTATALRELGATVEATDASIGYLRASVPVADVDRVTAVDGVRQVDVDEPIGQPDPTP